MASFAPFPIRPCTPSVY